MFPLSKKSREPLLCLLLFTLLLAACSSSTPTKASKLITPTSTSQAPLALSYNCQLQRTPAKNVPFGQEVQGVAHQSELWALLQPSTNPPQANSDVKIVWRMTGSGDFSLLALGPQGERLLPQQGPEIHEGSNWQHPGDEWGSVFVFPTSGCWDLHASRNNASGDVWLNIVR